MKKEEWQNHVESQGIKLDEHLCEWGGILRCQTSDGRIVNAADELNRLERIAGQPVAPGNALSEHPDIN